MKVGTFIRTRRLVMGHSLRALATRVGVDPAYLSRVERGLVPASQSFLRAVSRVLDVPIENLFLLDGRIPPSWRAAISSSPETATRVLQEAVARLPPADSRPTSTPGISGRRAIETDAFPFEHLSDIAEAESWRKEINRPIYHVHKWWAQRLGSVFRGILLGCFSDETSDVMKLFYSPTRIPDIVVFDPFMGSGTTVGEALKLGARAIGRDINPVSCFAVQNALRRHSRRELSDAFHRIVGDTRTKLLSLYSSVVAGQPVTVQYYFWVKHLPCPRCQARVDLFRTYVFSKHAYPKRHPEAKVICPHCDKINDRIYSVGETACDHCGCVFDATRGPARGIHATCPHCDERFRIITQTQSLGEPLPHRMFAKVWIDDTRRRRYEAIEEVDNTTFSRAAIAFERSSLSWPRVRIQPGYNTNQALANGYTYWTQMFNERQLIVLGTLAQSIAMIDEVGVREMLLCAFSGLLEFNNMFASFKGEGTGAVRHMFAHHIIKPERLPFETNPLARDGSGTFEGIFRRRVLRAIEYAREPFELRPGRSGEATKKIGGLSEPLGFEATATAQEFDSGGRLYLSTGDSARTDLAPESVDAIVTDPPFFDNVNYSELADFFWVWQRHFRSGDGDARPESTRSEREVQHQDHGEFAQRLAGVWAECRRVLVRDGVLVFTYHHSKSEGWESLLTSLVEARFAIVACHPVKSELSVSAPKAQARNPIDVDVVIVCRKRESDDRPAPQSLADILVDASAAAHSQVLRFGCVGRTLGYNDIRVLLTAQILRPLSWGIPLPLAQTWLKESRPFIDATTENVVRWQAEVARIPAVREDIEQIALF